MQLTKKKEQNTLTEKEYREIQRLSYSSLKLFDSDRRRFYKEIILNDLSTKEPDSLPLIMGSLIHCLLSEQDICEKFHLLNSIEPTGQLKLLADELYNRTLLHTTDGIQTEKFETLFMDSVQAVKYNYNGKEVAFIGKTIEKIVDMFSNSNAEIYYRERLCATGKMIVSVGTLQKAEELVNKLKCHSYTSGYVNIKTAVDIVVYNELPILFELDGVSYKAMIDKVVIDNKRKVIQLIDWKSSWSSESPEYLYTKMGYYLQAVMYQYAMEEWIRENGYEDYKIEPMKFIFIDTTGFSDPVILELSNDDIERAYRGFTIRGRKFKGLNTLMKEISWHVETGIWSTSYEVHKNNGIIPLKLDYGSRK